MPIPSRTFRAYTGMIKRGIDEIQTGGDWALRLPDSIRKNLVRFFYDGFFSSASDNIIVTYLVVYLLSLGATQAQIGLMSSLSSLSAALMLLPGALLVERIGHRKEIAVLTGGIAGRLMMAVVAILPFLLNGPILVTVAIAAAILRDMLGNLGFPAWMSLTGSIVPIEGRGRYFSSRNIAMAFAGITTTLVAGVILERVAQPIGYQFAILIAVGIGLLSTYNFSRISDPETTRQFQSSVKAAGSRTRMREVAKGARFAIQDLRAHPEFMALLIVTAFWNFSLNIAGPFFNVYLVKNLSATASMIGITSIASIVASMLAQRKLGELNDRWGARKLQMISGLLIPVVPVLWVFSSQAWHIIPINILSGVLWGAFSLASFNYLLELTPDDKRARYSAVYQVTVMLALAVGAAAGSLIVTQFGYVTVFVGSGIGRLMAAILFAYFIRRSWGSRG